MSLSIIIPTKNEEKNLPRLLKSILHSTTLPQEIIIIDNHSSDKTLSIAKKILKNYSLLPTSYSLYSKGPERSTQKNFGAQKAKGTHLLFLDADMEVRSKLPKELASLIRKNIKAAIIPEQSIGHGFWGKATALERNCYQNQPLLEAPRFFQKKLFLKIKGFDSKLIAGEDWDLKERLNRKNIKIARTKNKLLHHEPKSLKDNLKRKWYYTTHIKKYAQKHPLQFTKQASLKNRFIPLWKNKTKLLLRPLHTLAFLSVKSIIYINWKLKNL